MTISKLPPPYPRMGEIYRALALAFDTKAKNRDVDRYAREGDVDWRLPVNLIHELFLEPIKEITNTHFSDFLYRSLVGFHQNYISLVGGVEVNTLPRENCLPILIEHYFIPYGALALYEAGKNFGCPNLIQLLSNQTTTAAVFSWLSPDDPSALIKSAYPDSVGSDKTSKDNILRWIKGEHLPDLSSIKLLLGALQANGTSTQALENIGIWLLIARAVDWFEKKCDASDPKALMRSFILSGRLIEQVE